MKVSILIALFSFHSSLSFAAPVYLDFQDPVLARQIASANNIQLYQAEYISNGCVACNRTNYVIAGFTPTTAIGFGYAPGYVHNYKKVTFLLGEWYAPDQAGPDAGSITFTYYTSTGFSSQTVIPYPTTPVFMTADAGANGYLTRIDATMTSRKQGYTPYMDNMTFYHEADLEEKVELTIAQMRIAQRVFEPSATDGATNDLVAKKPFAVEVTLAATVPEKHKNLLAQATLYIDGNLHSSSDVFEISKIVSGQSKAFILGSADSAGEKTFEIQISPYGDWPADADQSSLPRVTRAISIHETQLSVMVNEISGCAPFISSCFGDITSNEREFFRNVQIPLANQLLPISPNGLQVSQGLNWSLSTPGFGTADESIYRDTVSLWIQKKISLKNIGVSLVPADYFLKHGYDTLVPDAEGNINETEGLVLPDQQGIAFLRGRVQATFAHELIHSLAFHLDHSDHPKVEGFGINETEIWVKDGISLHPHTFQLGNLASNIFYKNDQDNQGVLNLNAEAYNASFKAILSGKIDPKVVLVTGVLSSNNSLVTVEIQRAESFLDPAVANPDIFVQGLDQSGNVVTTVSAKSNSRIELLKTNGSSVEIITASSFFAATLPDDGTITNVRLIKGSQTIFTKPVDKITLESAVNGLNVNSFNLKPVLAKVALSLVKLEFNKYLKFRYKHPKVAIISLRLMRDTIRLSLKDNFVLADGRSFSKKQFVELIDLEINLLK